jgi:hypothetical protein
MIQTKYYCDVCNKETINLDNTAELFIDDNKKAQTYSLLINYCYVENV